MKKLYRFYTLCLLLLLCVSLFCVQAFAVEDMWTAANRSAERHHREIVSRKQYTAAKLCERFNCA